MTFGSTHRTVPNARSHISSMSNEPGAAAASEYRRRPMSQAATTPHGQSIEIRLATRGDAADMASIYNHEVQNFTTTLDMIPRTQTDQQAWITARSGAFSAIVATTVDDNGEEIVVGFASLSPFRDRPAYSPTVENSVYVSRSHGGRGIGRQLMDNLVTTARDSGFHSMIARIEQSGEASLALHRSVGFELIGVEHEVGRKLGRWLNVAIMQLML
ncbi:MAG: L-amino acid N-acyltransferase YncA [Candidatus Aldehydirespiratoraceae bacterium]|jgi:L-amino acid N-acyltransferase YncA